MDHRKLIIDLQSQLISLKELQARVRVLLVSGPRKEYQFVDVQLKSAIYHLTFSRQCLIQLDAQEKLKI